MKSINNRSIITFCVTLLLGSTVFVAPARAVYAAGLPAKQLLNPDGTLDLSSGYSGTLDTTNYSVSLDPARGPIFKPLAVLNTWNGLGAGLNGSVQVIAVSGADVYAGGSFTDAGGVLAADRIAKFSGGTWSALGTGLNATVYALAISGTDIYAGGDFTDAGGVLAADHIAKFSGGSWSALGTGLNAFVGGIAISGTDVYAGGDFTDAGGVLAADYIAKFSGGTWFALGATPLNADVITIAISGADVYAGGYFNDAGGVLAADYIAKFSGGSWSALGTGLNSNVLEIAISGGDVYAVGGFTDAGGVAAADRIAKFSSGAWSALGAGVNNGQVVSLAINGGDVYVGGNFTDVGGVAAADYIAKFSGGVWSALGATPLNASVTSIVIGGDLYVGGYFNDAGGVAAADSIARFEIPKPVNTASDVVLNDNLCSLREAIINANNDALTYDDCNPGTGNDTITFADGVTTISLGATLPNISDPDGLTIDGGGDVTVSGNDIYRVLIVNSTIPLTLNNLTVAHGACPSCNGGGIVTNGGIVNLTNSTFSNNQQGINIYNGTLIITNSTFSGNSGGYGGGVNSSGPDGTLTITNSTFSGNTTSSGFGGGGVYIEGNANITNSTFSNNTSGRGSLYNGGTTNVANSTFSGNNSNSTSAVAGVYNQGTLTITNSTFSGNGAVSGAGDIFQLGFPSVLHLYNNILANTTTGGNCIIGDGTVTGNNNLIEQTGASACGFTNGVNGNITGFDPNLGALTGSPQYFPLNLGSLAINAGDDTACAAVPVNNTSQNGVTRPAGVHCDIGSFEWGASIDVTIGGASQGSYVLGPSGSVRVNYAGVDSGPVRVASTNGVSIISAIRDAWVVNGVTTSFSQLMGLPLGQVSDKYVFPGYNNVTLDDQLRIGNVDTVPSTVTVTIGGVLRGTYILQPNEAVRINYAGLDSGPVIVDGTDGVDIISAIREAWSVSGTTTSFVQLMGLPAIQLSDKYVFPGYNNVTLNEQLRIGNVDTVPSTVTVTIGGALQGTYILQPNEAVRVNYAGLDSGPVVVQGTLGVNIISAIRDAWMVNGVTTSFAQLMGMPATQLSDQYLFPAYNNVTLNDQLRIGNVDTVPSTVTVTIGGVLRGSYTLQPDEAVRVNYAGLDSGPVVVQGTLGVHIISAIREAWSVNSVTQSFVQLMGLPFGQLSTTYLFPAYNNVTLNEQLRIGVP